MNTLTIKLLGGVIGVATVGVCLAGEPELAEKSVKPPASASKQENIGVATGLAVGAAAGGPVGALVGAAAGAWLGDRYHRQAVARAALAADLEEVRTDRTRLSQNVVELNASLAKEQERGEQLDLTLSHTDDVETDVMFRTNDDSIPMSSMSPLLKLGALAASMPAVRVHVDGYADPRGPKDLNDALSRRRADAVAAVLASAGVPKEQLLIEGHGSEESTCGDGDLEGYAFDRKVTVRLERGGSQSVASND